MCLLTFILENMYIYIDRLMTNIDRLIDYSILIKNIQKKNYGNHTQSILNKWILISHILLFTSEINNINLLKYFQYGKHNREHGLQNKYKKHIHITQSQRNDWTRLSNRR